MVCSTIFKAYIFCFGNIGRFFWDARKKAFGLGRGDFCICCRETNDFLLDRIVENERESKKPKMSGGVIPRLYCSQCQKIIALCEPAPSAEGSVD